MVTFRASLWLKLHEGGLGTGNHVPPAQILGPCEGEELACFWLVCDLWLGFRNDSLLNLGWVLDCGCSGPGKMAAVEAETGLLTLESLPTDPLLLILSFVDYRDLIK